ncbi:MAG: cytochrome bc complex cytochrome b subunit [Candidatus Glassbacteria bacterium]
MGLLRKAVDWIDVRIGIRDLIRAQLTEYTVPKNINIWYSLGFLSLFIFIVQIATGIFLLTYYVPDVDKAFQSIDKIMNEVPFGWLFRLIHAVGANMMVIVLFLHALSTLFMGSYKKPRELHWVTGFVLFLLTLSICLSGYLLPWSQLSYWATTVATNSPGSIPLIGEMIVKYTRGGDLVGPVTLGRFFASHVVGIPMIMLLVVGIHLFLVRRTGISQPPVRKKEEGNSGEWMKR